MDSVKSYLGTSKSLLKKIVIKSAVYAIKNFTKGLKVGLSKKIIIKFGGFLIYEKKIIIK